MPRSKVAAFAIVRFDGEVNDDLLSIVQIRDTQADAEEEARRLADLNASKNCRYVVIPTRRVVGEG